MDKDPLEQLNIPILARVWQEIEEGKNELPAASVAIPPALMKLKPALLAIFKEVGGSCKVWEVDFNNFLVEILKILETMIKLGFYSQE